MEIALIIAVMVLVLGTGFALGSVATLRSTVERDRSTLAELIAGLRGEIERADVRASTAIGELRTYNEAMRDELVRVCEETLLAQRAAPRAEDGSPPAAALPDDDPEIPPALVGQWIHDHLVTLAAVVGRTPVFLLRAAIARGLTGDEPLFSAADLATLRTAIAEVGPPISGTVGRDPSSGPRGS